MIQLAFCQFVLALLAGASGLTVMSIRYIEAKTALLRDLILLDLACLASVLVYGIGSYSIVFGYSVPPWFRDYSIPIFMVLACARYGLIVLVTRDLVGLGRYARALTLGFAITTTLAYALSYAFYASVARVDEWEAYLSIRSVIKDVFFFVPFVGGLAYLIARRRDVPRSARPFLASFTALTVAPIILSFLLLMVDPILYRQYVDFPMIVFFLSNVSIVAYRGPSARTGGRAIVAPARSGNGHSDLARAYGITKREYEILLLIVEGNSHARIAERLFISPHTVRNHVANAYRKLGIDNQLELYKALFA